MPPFIVCKFSENLMNGKGLASLFLMMSAAVLLPLNDGTKGFLGFGYKTKN